MENWPATKGHDYEHDFKPNVVFGVYPRVLPQNPLVKLPYMFWLDHFLG